ncbi:MAG: AGE family epimerase/isomerase [Clostridiales bacterium]|nr:AGE family epimerase/isomerase [Clostridiales bacterium]
MRDLKKFEAEMREHLTGTLIPFWMGLRDEEKGGWYGWLSYDLKLDRNAEKGCILNSRITWFFSSAYRLYRDGLITEAECEAHGFHGEDLRAMAVHGYRFLSECCMDPEYGGLYWSVNADGSPCDTTKHTYNQAFGIYALCAYYEVMGETQAIELAWKLYSIIEGHCSDAGGYLEAFTRDFGPESNEKLSENGVMATRTMNTLLHVFEAYTEFYKVTGDACVKERLVWILNTFADKMFNPEMKRQEVFFDADYNTLIDLHSYGHDIETSWLLDRGLTVLGDADCTAKVAPMARTLSANIYDVAFDGHSLADECERGVVNTGRIWWVQAETVVGFLNAWQREPHEEKYLDAALSEWEFVKTNQVDHRPGSEWYWLVDESGAPVEGKPIVEPWKCPYHNGRMCMEVIRRLQGEVHDA